VRLKFTVDQKTGRSGKANEQIVKNAEYFPNF